MARFLDLLNDTYFEEGRLAENFLRDGIVLETASALTLLRSWLAIVIGFPLPENCQLV